MSNAVNLNQKLFFVLTGASRGIGQSMAVECAAKASAGSLFVLLARSIEGLEQTKSQMLSRNHDISVKIFAIDLTHPSPEELLKIFIDSLADNRVEDFQLAVIVHNVGSIGDVTKFAKDFGDDEKVFQDYYALNVFGVIALNRVFLNLFDAAKSVQRLVVNVTSLCAVKPCKSFTLYCSGKAARQMYFRILALEADEEDPHSNLIVLNYSPGPVETEMTATVEAHSTADSVREIFKDMRVEKTILQPIDTTKRFIEILEKGNFKSGDRFDYYDPY